MDELTIWTAVVSLIASALAAMTSLVGFVVTTIMAIRKEKRESALANIEIAKRELELRGLLKGETAAQGAATNPPALS